jgi:hypothetical protein
MLKNKEFNYSISKEDIFYIDKKINFQKDYLFKHKSLINQETEECQFTSSYSANTNSKKNFAEINNRINNILNNSKEKGLKPCFITITAPSKYHKKDK